MANSSKGFTLIELSIVLVIIGLIVGGVLVGRDLIAASEIRAQISQIEKLNTAVNTFRGKFNAIPGDMAASIASSFGFIVGTSCSGSGLGNRDGNGMIDGVGGGGGAFIGGVAGYEAGLIWQDLSSSTAGNLIEGSFSGINCNLASTSVTTTGLASTFPSAKLGRGMYITAYNYNGTNWWGLFGFSSISNGELVSVTTPMSVLQAYNIDTKMDDGKPTTGNAVAQYIASILMITEAPSAASSSSSTCYETTNNTYSISTSNGAGGNCALSFRFQ